MDEVHIPVQDEEADTEEDDESEEAGEDTGGVETE